jgi:hypothetical protein
VGHPDRHGVVRDRVLDNADLVNSEALDDELILAE